MPGTPKVLIIGDSISLDYTSHLARMLDGRCRVVHCEGNAGDSDRVVGRLDEWLGADDDAAAVYFNCGLHDLKRSRQDARYQVPIERYRENLMAIARRLAESRRAIWATTTPVIEERHTRAKDFDRHQADVQAYNAVAGTIMLAAGIPVSDLHQAVLAGGLERCICDDGVHMTSEGSQLLARVAADDIANHVPTG